MSKELAEKVNRLRNTYNYSVESSCGDDLGTIGPISDSPGRFNFRISNFPFPQHNNSQLAVFNLKSFYILNQGSSDVQRATNTLDADASGFNVFINGLGMMRQFNQSKRCKLESTSNAFTIINKYALNTATTGTPADVHTQYNRVSGGEYYGEECLISNPAGTDVIVEVYDVDDDSQISTDRTKVFFSRMEFSIELIPPDVSNGDY
jgi:hypothetical protein